MTTWKKSQVGALITLTTVERFLSSLMISIQIIIMPV